MAGQSSRAEWPCCRCSAPWLPSVRTTAARFSSQHNSSLAAAIYVGCFEAASCSTNGGSQQELTLLAEDPAMTPAICLHLAQVWLQGQGGCPETPAPVSAAGCSRSKHVSLRFSQCCCWCAAVSTLEHCCSHLCACQVVSRLVRCDSLQAEEYRFAAIQSSTKCYAGNSMNRCSAWSFLNHQPSMPVQAYSFAADRVARPMMVLLCNSTAAIINASIAL